jgi:hypothetical protein
MSWSEIRARTVDAIAVNATLRRGRSPIAALIVIALLTQAFLPLLTTIAFALMPRGEVEICILHGPTPIAHPVPARQSEPVDEFDCALGSVYLADVYHPNLAWTERSVIPGLAWRVTADVPRFGRYFGGALPRAPPKSANY